jgi:hypothetical protein
MWLLVRADGILRVVLVPKLHDFGFGLADILAVGQFPSEKRIYHVELFGADLDVNVHGAILLANRLETVPWGAERCARPSSRSRSACQHGASALLGRAHDVLDLLIGGHGIPKSDSQSIFGPDVIFLAAWLPSGQIRTRPLPCSRV